ncbi:MAG: MoaD/ThiS family protein [Dehalococcoidales bacterium]|nr:MoaD/ThiS family protein [Dehalococcoidales bacterium]
MSIKMNISPVFLQYTNNQRVVEVEGTNVGEALDHLTNKFPSMKNWLFDKKSKLLDHINIYVNGHSAYPENLGKPIKDGDEISIIFMVGGG